MATVSDLTKKYLDQIDIFMAANYVAEIYFNHDGSMTCLSNESRLFTAEALLPRDCVVDFIWQLAWDSKVRIDPFCPFAGGIIPGAGLRWHAVIPPASPDGPVLTIRRQALSNLEIEAFTLQNFSAEDLVDWQKNNVSVVFFGATGSGKTSLLHATLKRSYAESRVGIIESIVELPLSSKFWFRLVQVGEDLGGRGGVQLESLTAEMLRLSPQVIVLGEVRRSEARIWFELSKTGHGGVMTTMHAGCVSEAKSRLKNLLGMDGDLSSKIMGVHVFRMKAGSFSCRAVSLTQS